ncbi:MAG: rod-binding protein [Rhodospirillales bacterium]|nr:rod-binding protein [Rhodospirillales bacterium]
MTVQATLPGAALNLADQAAARQPKVGGASKAQIEKTARDFESFFLSQMYQHMFAGIATDGVFGGGHGEEVFRSFMLDEYAKLTARTGRVGLSQNIAAQMLRQQEVGHARAR